MRRRPLAFPALILLTVALVPTARAAVDPVPVPSADETTPVASTGDSMDDPAIWVHPRDPARSLVLGNNKRGALETYDLHGDRVQRLTDEVRFWGNVDVRQQVTVSGVVRDVVAVYHRGLQLYRVDPASRLLTPINEGVAISTPGEGLCLYESPVSGRLYAILIAISGELRQFEIRDTDGDGLLEGRLVRQFAVGSEAEGCVADDDNGHLYVSEENVALWQYAAEPTAGTTRTAIGRVGDGVLVNDLEGVTLVDLPDGGGQVIVSVQNAPDPNHSYFVAYDRLSGELVRTFRVTSGPASDDCDRTDGITALHADLGPAYPDGLFVCQDNNNDAPGTVGNQDLKYVPLGAVVDVGEPPPPAAISAVGGSVVNRKAKRFAVRVPAGVQAGDGLVLSFSRPMTADPRTGPGAGWTLLGDLVDGTLQTTHWQRVATAADAGRVVQVSYPSRKPQAALSVVAYRGTSTTVPFATAVGAAEPGFTAAHTTPVTDVPAGGAWRVSYWADRSSTAAGWTPPAGEQVRVLSAGSGGGRICVLVSDPGAPVPAGPTGGLTATAASASDKATAWTILLR